MNRVEKLFNLTKIIENTLDGEITPGNRQEIIDKVNDLIEERGQCLEKVSAPYSEEEIQLGKEVVKMNQGIQEKMDTLFPELKQEMKQMKKKKTSNRNYVNPYQNVQTMDGMFLDKKK